MFDNPETFIDDLRSELNRMYNKIENFDEKVTEKGYAYFDELCDIINDLHWFSLGVKAGREKILEEMKGKEL